MESIALVVQPFGWPNGRRNFFVVMEKNEEEDDVFVLISIGTLIK